jgi:hypothetical protein
MKLVNYLEAIMVGNYVIKKFIEPTLKTKKHFWIPLREKYTRDLQPKKMIAIHQLGISHLDKLLKAQKKRISISTFTNTNDIKKLADYVYHPNDIGAKISSGSFKVNW